MADAFASEPLVPLWTWLRTQAIAESGPGRLMPWIPVAFGTGIATYFAATREPVAWVAVFAAFAAICVAFAMRRTRGFVALTLIAAAFAGFAAASLKTLRVSHGVLARPVYAASITGYVETREERERTDRFVLRVAEMTTARDGPKLSRVRLSVKKGTAPLVGSFVSLKARLLPPLQPLRPGAYDFARDMYFQGLGASGFVMGTVETRAPPEDGGIKLRYAAAIQNLRDAIDARIRGVISGDNRAIATALLTGRRDAISAPVNDALFVSGLGHVLSISGYHMAVVAGIVFFAVRALLALIPLAAGHYPIKKWSAGAALLAATFYLLLSGAEVATQRSYVMTAVVLIAVLVDRRAITFRTLAIAAMAVLAIAPEAIVHPSFQMSFAATLGLVALVSYGLPRLFATPDSSTTARVALWGGREVIMLALASLVAGLATTPYAAYHFHRITPYGVLANLAAMPVVSAVVMPAGILGLVAMPFGLDGFCWRVMDLGIDWMIAVSGFVAALPGAVGRIGAFGTGPMILASGGIVALGLLRSQLRWLGLVGLVASALWALDAPRPDILVAPDATNAAVRGVDGRLRVLRAAKDSFQVREWLAADADRRDVSDATLQDGVSCDADGCVTALVGGGLAALALKPGAMADDCAQAKVIVTALTPPKDCAAFVVALDDVRSRGALSLRRVGPHFKVEAAREPGDVRPWSSPALSQFAPQMAPMQATGKRAPIDATPTESDLRADD